MPRIVPAAPIRQWRIHPPGCLFITTKSPYPFLMFPFDLISA